MQGHAALIVMLVAVLTGCGRSSEEEAILLDDTYNEGYLDALDCVSQHGGLADSAASYCRSR